LKEIKLALSEEGKVLAIKAVQIGAEQLVDAIRSGDLSAIYAEHANLPPRKAALLRERLASAAYEEKEARDEAFVRELRELAAQAVVKGITVAMMAAI